MLRIGIVGTSAISDWFADAARRIDGVDVTAVFSRSEQRGRTFSDQHGILTVFTALDAMLAGPECDAVYVASPMYAHASQTISALEQGKHVLCEKTLGTSIAECDMILEAAQRADKVVLEEIRPIFDPAWAVIRDNLHLVGELRRVAFEKNQYSSRYDNYLRGTIENAFRPELGNSALGDIGVYCLQPALWLFGEPEEASSTCIRLANQFDGAGSLLLSYGSFFAECTYSKITESTRPSVIEGEAGSILIDSLAEPSLVRFVPRIGDEATLWDEHRDGPWANLHHVVTAFVQMCAEGHGSAPYNALSRRTQYVMQTAKGGPVE